MGAARANSPEALSNSFLLKSSSRERFLEIGTRHSCYASQWGADAELTNLQNTFRIDLPIAARFQDFLVTGTFSLFYEARSQPPNQWVKPKDGFDHHVDRSGQIVATAYVPQLVRENGFEVRIFQAFGDSFGP